MKMYEDITYKVVEIFGSIEGEGKRVGAFTTFIRFFECNLRCHYCDTKYSYETNGYKVLSLAQIIKEIERIGYKNITITGGEPLIQKDLDKLVTILDYNGYDVNIETNGSLNPYTVIPALDSVWVTMDYKTLSSGSNYAMNIKNFFSLGANDVIKCVVGCVKDMEDALRFIRELKPRTTVYFSPVYGSIQPSEIVDFLKKEKEKEIRVQVQLHKIIWSPEARGV